MRLFVWPWIRIGGVPVGEIVEWELLREECILWSTTTVSGSNVIPLGLRFCTCYWRHHKIMLIK